MIKPWERRYKRGSSLPRRQRSHENANEQKNRSEHKGGPEQAIVGRPPGEGTHEEKQKDLDGANPGNIGLGVPKCRDVVCLEHTEAVYVAPGVEDDQVAYLGSMFSGSSTLEYPDIPHTRDCTQACEPPSGGVPGSTYDDREVILLTALSSPVLFSFGALAISLSTLTSSLSKSRE